MNPMIRPADASEADLLTRIEAEADQLLIQALGAQEWPPPADGASRLSGSGFVLVAVPRAADSPAGFAHVLEADGCAHLEQLSVAPVAARQGVGRALVHAAITAARERGHPHMTLRTYAQLPWNAPFYASCGFVVTQPETPFQRALIDAEARMGLDRYGPRVQMAVALRP